MKPKPETIRTLDFTLSPGNFYVSGEANICASAVKALFGTKAKRIRITGSLSKPKGKGWRSVRVNTQAEMIIVSGRKFPMLWSLELFLVNLGVADKRFYVRLEK